MKLTTLKEKKGFEVLHDSTEWRIAIHAYEEKVNGKSSFKNWGRHMDSQEAFLLLKGKGWLITSPDGEEAMIHELTGEEIVVVESGERHAILLGEDSAALIIENEDMSNSVTEPIEENLRERTLEKIAV